MQKEKILVVDDEKNICDLLRMYLEKEGYAVVMAHNGLDAVKMFSTENPDLVLLDIMLPQLDGWQVCREIRKTSEKPIIMLTAKDEVFDKVLGLELGADDYVTKPFDTKEIVARIKAVLRRTSAVKEADIKEVSENTYIANAMMRIDELVEFFDLDHSLLEEDDVETIAVESNEKYCKIAVKVNKEDLGRIIGRKGRIANAIRTIAHAAAVRENVRLEIDLGSEEAEEN